MEPVVFIRSKHEVKELHDALEKEQQWFGDSAYLEGVSNTLLWFEDEKQRPPVTMRNAKP
jgi:hypothetical protein